MIVRSLRQHRPGGADVLVGQGHRGLAVAAALDQRRQPVLLAAARLLELLDIGAGTLDQCQQASKIPQLWALKIPHLVR